MVNRFLTLLLPLARPRGHLLPALCLLTPLFAAQKFYPDDPLPREPAPWPMRQIQPRPLNELFETYRHIFFQPSRARRLPPPPRAQSINTADEVMDGAWFVNRHGRRRMTLAELQRGPGQDQAPSSAQPFEVLALRKYDPPGPCLLLTDAKGDIYLLRFDPPGHPELLTGAAMIASRLFHALGYHVPEHYLLEIRPSALRPAPAGKQIDAVGGRNPLTEDQIDLFFSALQPAPSGAFRAVAQRIPSNSIEAGPFRFAGLRLDDPNDTVPHEHRRELRALYVFSSWVANNFISPLQTLDLLLNEGGTPHLRHFLWDFSTALGSAGKREKHAWEGYEPMFETARVRRHLLGFGFYTPSWQRAFYPPLPAVGRFESAAFDPARWAPNYDSPALAQRRKDDDFWAARLVMAFTNEEIRALVDTGRYSDPKAAAWITRSLIERRDKIGRHYFEQVLPLVEFHIEDGTLQYKDLAAEAGFRSPLPLTARWFLFDNATSTKTPLGEGLRLPSPVLALPPATYCGAEITSPDHPASLTVYFRREPAGFRVVGLERN